MYDTGLHGYQIVHADTEKSARGYWIVFQTAH